MASTPSIVDFALLLGLSFFLGLAFEDVSTHSGIPRPGGIRTFPLLAIIGGVLYLLDSGRLIPFTAGLVVLGGWLLIYYREHSQEKDEDGQPNIGLVVPLLNIYAYVLGPMALALPHWVAVGATVAAVLLFTARAGLHDLARRIEMKEIITAAEFLILTGLVLPLLPDTPVTNLTTITPHQVWLSLIVVSTVSYASYLSQRYLPGAAEGLWMAALGGLYSSTATTVVLAREAKAEPERSQQAQAGITLATAIMYVRVLVIVGIFNLALARRLAPALCGLALAALAISIVQYRFRKQATKPDTLEASRNPLELGTAIVFASLFVLTSLLSTWVTGHFGIEGIYWLAAAIGFADIDPFVLNLAQGGTSGVPETALAASILIAASSNNLLKAVYAVIFGGGRATAGSVAALILLAAGGLAVALLARGL